MALVKCKECGGQVSTAAKTCPACGAPAPRKTSGVTLFVGGIFAFVVLMLVFRPDGSKIATAPSATSQPAASTAQKEAEYQAAREARQKATVEECTTGLADVMKRAQDLAKAGDEHMAAATLNPCNSISKDPALAALVKKIEAARMAKVAKAAKDEAARKKKEGVSIGMSKEDVLASNWGKPRKVNATTTARGTREQWVYDGGYLYFQDDTLVTIQN